MNRLFEGFVYVPVDVPSSCPDDVAQVLELVASDVRVPAVNITAPHKSCAPLRRFCFGDPDDSRDVDTLFRVDGVLSARDLNSSALLDWYAHAVGSLVGRVVVVFGVGGVGRPLAQRLAGCGVAGIVLVDPYRELSGFASRLSGASGVPVEVSSRLRFPAGVPVTVFNAAGKDSDGSDVPVQGMFDVPAPSDGVYVDLAPHVVVPGVSAAVEHGWAGYTGHGMNVFNDFVLATHIGEYMRACGVDVAVPSLDVFAALVAADS